MKLTINQPVWYTKAKKKAVVKEINGSKVKITYFSPEDKRVIVEVDRRDLKEYKSKQIPEGVTPIITPMPIEWEPIKFHQTIKIKYHTDIDKIAPISIGNWIDLRAAETVEIKAGECKLISLGVSMKLPDGYEAHIVPRSSTFKNWHIIQANQFGVIDNSYSGTNDVWRFPAYAVKNTIIQKNDRICQFRIQPIMGKVIFEEVDSLDDIGRGGFGSTGKN